MTRLKAAWGWLNHRPVTQTVPVILALIVIQALRGDLLFVEVFSLVETYVVLSALRKLLDRDYLKLRAQVWAEGTGTRVTEVALHERTRIVVVRGVTADGTITMNMIRPDVALYVT